MKYKTIGMILVSGFLLLLIQCSCKEDAHNETGNNSPPLLSPPAEILSTETVDIGGQTFTLELAFTRENRRQGLMFRRELPADRGMLFIFEQADTLSFHMQNCLIDLDILFLREDGSIAQINTMKAPPPGEPSEYYSCNEFCTYAVELPAGTAERLQLKIGDKIPLPRRIRNIIPDPD